MSSKNNDGRGFAGVEPERLREIASEGGRAAHASGNAHEWDAEEAREAGRLGGAAEHHHRTAAFHHATAAHHHGEAARHHGDGRHHEATMHAAAADEHARSASHHGRRAKDEDERTRGWNAREELRDEHGRFVASGEAPSTGVASEWDPNRGVEARGGDEADPRDDRPRDGERQSDDRVNGSTSRDGRGHFTPIGNDDRL